MKTIETRKLNYLRPMISVCNVLEESFILAASPEVRNGGSGGGSISIVPLKPETGENDDEVVGE